MFSPHSATRSRRGTLRALGVALATAAALALTACGTTAAAPTDSRVYESDFGPVTIPEHIERIVSVDFYTPAALLDLGVTPVGVVNSYFTDTEGVAIPLNYGTEIRESDAKSIGEYYELNLEAIAQARPDVVLATEDFLPLDDPLRPEIEKIAPIITFNARDGEAWRTRSVELAKILDREAELAPIEAKYVERRDELKAKYADLLATQTFTVLVPDETTWGTYADTHFSTPVLRDLGAKFREQQPDEMNDAGFPEWFSYEEIGRLSNADVALILPHVAQENRDALAKNTIWQNLPLAQNGMVFDYIKLNPTGSFGWALQNLESFDTLFAAVQAKLDAQG